MTHQTITVQTQADLDAALAAHRDDCQTTILIDSPAEVRLRPSPEALYSTDGLAAYLGVPVTTVYKWNKDGTGPRRISVGKYVRYRPVDVERWLDARAIDTARAGAA